MSARPWPRPAPVNGVLLHLEPRELGSLLVQVRVSDKRLIASFRAQSPEAEAILRAHLPALHEIYFSSAALLESGDWGWRVAPVKSSGAYGRRTVLELSHALLWDQDERMIMPREALLERKPRRKAPPVALTLCELRQRLPLAIEVDGEPLCLFKLEDGTLTLALFDKSEDLLPKTFDELTTKYVVKQVPPKKENPQPPSAK